MLESFSSLLFYVICRQAILIQPTDYAKATLKVFAELFTKSDKKHRSKKATTNDKCIVTMPPKAYSAFARGEGVV